MRVPISTRLRMFLGAAGALFAVLCMALPAMAAESVDSAVATTNEVFRWLNFAVIFGGIAFLVAKSGGFFRTNAQAIAGDIRESSAAKAEAERELHDVEAKLSGLHEEVGRLRQQAQSDAAAEAERLRVSGRAEIEKINQAAAGELAATERIAQQDLRTLAASIAVDRAAALLQAEMTPEARARMFRAFLAEIGRGSAQGSIN